MPLTASSFFRAEQDVVNVFRFMTPAQVADVRAFTYTQNVTDALRAAASHVQAAGGGTLLFPKGGYLVGEQTFQGTLLDGVTPCAYGPEEIVTIKNCPNPVKVSGYGAVLKAADGLHYGSFDRATGNRYDPPSMPFLDYSYYAYPYRAMINLEGNASVVVEGFELDGNSMKLALGGYWGDSHRQLEGYGIWCRNNATGLLRDLYVHHQPEDGLTLNSSGVSESIPNAGISVKNVRSRYNGRLGLSITGGKNFIVENCDFSNTGQAMNAGSNELVRSTPGAGVDIEAEGGMIRDVVFTNCTVLGNWQTGIVAASGDSARVRVNACKIENLAVAKPDYVFTDTTIIGYFDVGLAAVDPYSGLHITSKDGQLFRNCRFSYDASLTESGTLVNAAQARLIDFLWGRMEGCTIQTGAVALPNLNVGGPVDKKHPLFINTRFSSTATTPLNMFARFQGYNYVDYGVAPAFNWGVNARIESGDVIVNGVGVVAAGYKHGAAMIRPR
jgi:hypothetical protein